MRFYLYEISLFWLSEHCFVLTWHSDACLYIECGFIRSLQSFVALDRKYTCPAVKQQYSVCAYLTTQMLAHTCTDYRDTLNNIQ